VARAAWDVELIGEQGQRHAVGLSAQAFEQRETSFERLSHESNFRHVAVVSDSERDPCALQRIAVMEFKSCSQFHH
jgi:hypothetical protein